MSNSVTNKELYEVVDNTRKEIGGRIDKLENKIDTTYVTHAELEPIKKLVYGAVAVILLSFVGAVVALVFKT